MSESNGIVSLGGWLMYKDSAPKDRSDLIRTERLLSNGSVFRSLLSNPPLVFVLVVHVKIVSFRLRRTGWIGIIEQILNSNEDLLEGNRRTPTFFLIQNG
jgi:hypothetical protein